MLRRVLCLLLVLLLPLAAAQEPVSLSSLEEPHKSDGNTNTVKNVIVPQDEANKDRVLVFRNPVGNVFNITVFDSEGVKVFDKRGHRGIQTLPGLPAGPYRFVLTGDGEYQVTDKAFEKILNTSHVETTLRGTDAYVLAPTKHYDVAFTGDVRVEWWSLVEAPEDLAPPFQRAAVVGGAYVITVRGDEGAAYTVTLTETEAPPTTQATPGLPVGGVVLALLATLALLALKRRT